MNKPLTNEQIAIKIKNGETSLYSLLWEQNEKLINSKAYKYIKSHPKRFASCGVEIDDLLQIGYIALYYAVEYFKPEKEYKLLTYFERAYKTQICELLGIRTTAKRTLNECISLNMTIGNNEDCELINLQEDHQAYIDFEQVEHKDYLRDLKDTFQHLFDTVLTADEQKIIKLKYFENYQIKQISEQLKKDNNTVKMINQRGINKLRKNNRKLKKFVDWTTTSYAYTGARLSAFKYSGVSVEQRIIERLEEM